jgi:hypothetical protein
MSLSRKVSTLAGPCVQVAGCRRAGCGESLPLARANWHTKRSQGPHYAPKRYSYPLGSTLAPLASALFRAREPGRADLDMQVGLGPPADRHAIGGARQSAGANGDSFLALAGAVLLGTGCARPLSGPWGSSSSPATRSGLGRAYEREGGSVTRLSGLLALGLRLLGRSLAPDVLVGA